MFDWVPLTAGAGILISAVIYFARDCRGNVSASMGGEMTFSTLWNIGGTLFCLGFFPLLDLSRLWAIAVVPLLFGLSFPLRSAIQRRVCTPYSPEPTGFQKFVRKTQPDKPSTNKQRDA